jgi:hypothetical protein
MSHCWTLLAGSAVLACVLSVAARGGTPEAGAVRKLLAEPPKEYSTAPFWVWNDELSEERVLGTLRMFRERGIRQVIVHPRPGLMTPYLGERWFALWKVALAEAERLDMLLWIYDENSYPSGFAGGHVPEAMPESRGRGLVLRESKAPPEPQSDVLAVFQVLDDRCADVTARVRGGEEMPEGTYLAATIARAGDNAWHGGRCYVDLLYPGVTQKFLEITLDAYVREMGAELGRRIPGSFTDEPELQPAGGLPWTDDLPAQFLQRWEYPLVETLPSLERQTGEWQRVRHNYYQTLLDLMIERWGRPYYEYCARHKLEFTGHYWEHEWPHCRMVPDTMAMYAWMQRPGIDTLMNEYDEGVHAQFGNVRAVKELASAAAQCGRARTLCEAYGAGGWDLRLADMKRIGDWLVVLGVNTLNEHLSYVSLRGGRKRDHPQSFGDHDPWWEAYGDLEAYFARLCAVLSQGTRVGDVLVLEPTTTAWMYQTPAGNEPRLKEIGDTFQKLVTDLEQAQVEFDLACESILEQRGAVEGGQLVIGPCRYRTVVLPPLTENLNRATTKLLEQFMETGGAVLCCGEPPTRVEGAPAEWGTHAAEQPSWRKVQAAELAGRLAKSADGFVVTPQAGKPGPVFHQRRQLADGQVVFVVNTSLDAPNEVTIAARAGGFEQWDAQTGATRSAVFERGADGSVTMTCTVPPCGSRLLFLPNAACEPAAPVTETTEVIEPVAPLVVQRVGPNVLTLDFVDVEVGGETKTNIHVLRAADLIFQKHGLPKNPWEGAVQFKDELIKRTFPAESGFAATYRFTIRTEVPHELWLVVERPDLYTITCNGKPVQAPVGEWWLDRSFGKLPLAGVAQVGENVVRIEARPMTVYHELEAACVIGDFGVVPVEKGFEIVPAPKLELGPWNAQAQPLYGGGVAYRAKFELAPQAGRTLRVALGKWYGAAAKVVVNGQPAGYIVAPPGDCDITKQARAGTNEIEVVVWGTLKNTLGPHHGKPPLGRAWPGMFHQAPEAGPPAGGTYSTVGYGLMEPFCVVEGQGG